jgi:hypothetical protein
MSRKYRTRDQSGIYFVTFTVIDWIDIFIRELIDQKLEFIHLNPVAAGFVDLPESWVHSSARDYAGTSRAVSS